MEPTQLLDCRLLSPKWGGAIITIGDGWPVTLASPLTVPLPTSTSIVVIHIVSAFLVSSSSFYLTA